MAAAAEMPIRKCGRALAIDGKSQDGEGGLSNPDWNRCPAGMSARNVASLGGGAQPWLRPGAVRHVQASAKSHRSVFQPITNPRLGAAMALSIETSGDTSVCAPGSCLAHFPP